MANLYAGMIKFFLFTLFRYKERRTKEPVLKAVTSLPSALSFKKFETCIKNRESRHSGYQRF